MKVARRVLAVLLAFILIFLGYLAVSRERSQAPAGQTIFLEPAAAEADFRQVLGPRELRFPEDHGPHPQFQTEWWYYTGNLVSEEGRRFGYQLTFFRRALIAAPDQQERESSWATSQIYMAHFALTDVEGEGFRAFDRFARGAVGLAGARAIPYEVWIGNWRAVGEEPGVHRLQAVQGGIEIDFVLTAEKPPVPHGQSGYSPKGPVSGQASHYYSYTRMRTDGTVRVGEVIHAVEGLSWMDHEWSTSALGQDQVGWDWFSLQLADGSELMLFQLRDGAGGIDPYSSGTYVGPDGEAFPLAVAEFDVEVLELWRSPVSGASYPARWRIDIPSLGERLLLTPLVKDQELRLAYTYWEGAVSIREDVPGSLLLGYGYVELTGYAGSMQGQF